MSVRWITWAWEQECESTGSKLTLIALADHASEDGECWPSTGRLAAKTGLGQSTVRRHIEALEECGLLVREHRYRPDGSQTTTLIKLGRGVLESSRGVLDGEQGGCSPVSTRSEPSVEPSVGTGETSSLAPAVVEDRLMPTPALIRRQLYDALARGCGWELDEMTKDSKRVTALAVNDLIDMGVDDPIEVTRRCAAYRVKYSGAACTPKAVVKHWPGLRVDLVEAEQQHRTRMSRPREESATERLDRLRQQRRAQ